jgi:hypothetical protein
VTAPAGWTIVLSIGRWIVLTSSGMNAVFERAMPA